MSRRLAIMPAYTLCFVLVAPIHVDTTTAMAAAPSKLGVIKAPTLEDAKAQAQAWLNELKPTGEVQKEFDGIWAAEADRPMLDRVVDTFRMGSPAAKKLLSEIDETSIAVEVPAILKDETQPTFLRANLGLAYARKLGNRRVHEQALEVLRIIRPEQVVDPASYYFFKAVAEHNLRHKDDGLASVNRLLGSVDDVPVRYRAVARLMKADFEAWKAEDLADIARLMSIIERRLDIARGGPKTQEQQKEVVALLDKMIKELEDECKKCQGQAGGAGSANRSSSPLPDSKLLGGAGEGNVARKQLEKTAEVWGSLPEKERIKAMKQLEKRYPAHYRQAIEEYLRAAARGGDK